MGRVEYTRDSRHSRCLNGGPKRMVVRMFATNLGEPREMVVGKGRLVTGIHGEEKVSTNVVPGMMGSEMC